MTYIDLINHFWHLAAINPFTKGQVSLYFALLHVCNSSYWQEWFSVPNQVLSVLTGLSRSGILKERNVLKQRGLLDFRERGTKATSYRIIIAESNQTNVLIANSKQVSAQDSVQNGMQDSAQDGVQNSSTLYKTKDKRQEEEKRKPPVSPVQRLDEFWAVYPNRQRRGLAEKAYCDLLRSGMVTEDDLVEAARNYAEHVRETGEKMYLPNNWLEKCVFEDFLPGRYARKTGKDRQEMGHEEKCGGDDEELTEEELAGDGWMDYGPGWRERNV